MLESLTKGRFNTKLPVNGLCHAQVICLPTTAKEAHNNRWNFYE